MFASIRRYKLKRGSTEEFARRMKDGFVALIREIPGLSGLLLCSMVAQTCSSPSVCLTAQMRRPLAWGLFHSLLKKAPGAAKSAG